MNQRCQLHTISPAASASAMTALPFAGACRRKEDAAFSGIERNGRNFLFQPFRHPKPVGFHAVGKRDRGIVSTAVATHRSVEHIIAGLADDITVGGSVPAQVDGRHRRLARPSMSGVAALHGLPLRSVTVSVTAVSDGVADAVTSSAPA